MRIPFVTAVIASAVASAFACTVCAAQSAAPETSVGYMTPAFGF